MIGRTDAAPGGAGRRKSFRARLGRTAGSWWRQLKDATSGATAVEYALIAAGLSIAIASVVFELGSDVAELFTGLEGRL